MNLSKKEKNFEWVEDSRQTGVAPIKVFTIPGTSDIYEGSINDVEKMDGFGTIYYSNKCYFKGVFKENEKERGVEIFPNGDSYNGWYQNNKFHGEGILENDRLKYKYEGEFKCGKKNGKGKEKYKSGAEYSGEFKNNEKNGRGKYISSDGSYYEGNFFNGLMHGYGIKTDKTRMNQDILIEKQNNDFKEDVAKLKKNEGGLINVDNEIDEFYYEGEFCYGLKHGIGRYYNKKGSYKYGQWSFDEMIGNVLHYFADENRWQLTVKEGIKEKILKSGDGCPPIKLDAYKSLIDDCGIKNEKLEDPFFISKDENLGIKTNTIEDFSFERLSNLYKKEKFDLFSDIIVPDQFIFKSFVNWQEIVCLEALTYCPYLLLKLFTPKYSSEYGFFILKFYIEGIWKEIVIDDLVPCKKGQCILVTNANEDIGWIILQKCIAKFYNSYFVEHKEKKIIVDFLKLLTALPTKIIQFQNIEKISNSLMKYSENKIKIVFLNQEFYELKNIPLNTPYILLSYINLNSENGLLNLKAIKNEYILTEQFDLSTLGPEEFQKLKKNCKSDEANQFFMSLHISKIMFSDVHILLGTENYLQNSFKFSIFSEQLEMINNKFYFEFKITVASKILINIEQLGYEDELLPLRMNLAKVILNSQDKIKEKKKNHSYEYIFGKGQKISKDLWKEIIIDSGNYILYLEFEINKNTTENKRNININIFSHFPIKINKRQPIQKYRQKIYKSLLLKSYDLALNKNKEIRNFFFFDLKDKPNGSEDLMIYQFFLKNEGVYLHYLCNNSYNRKWKQKLIFKIENMQVILDDEEESANIDIILDPGERALVIVQQVNGKSYTLEGGDGACFIDLLDFNKLERKKSIDLEKRINYTNINYN